MKKMFSMGKFSRGAQSIGEGFNSKLEEWRNFFDALKGGEGSFAQEELIIIARNHGLQLSL